jgi:hypothetical protein
MDEGRIICQGNYAEMEKNKEFTELMDINKLNKGTGDKKEEDSDSEKPVSMGDLSDINEADEHETSPEVVVRKPTLEEI